MFDDTGRWRVATDTGGTFTDCLAITPDGKRKRAKVLSSSRLRGRISRPGSQSIDSTCSSELPRCPDPLRIIADGDFDYPDHFIRGYRFALCAVTETPDAIESPSVVIADFDHSRREIVLAEPYPRPELLVEGALFEVISPEEAPVLATRVVMGALLDDPLPPISLRLGTTKGTNALLERKLARTLFLVTAGFEDILLIGDQRRPDLFALDIVKRSPLYADVVSINERIGADGTVVSPIDLEDPELHQRLQQAISQNCESIAICLLNSYANPKHEKMLEQYIRERFLMVPDDRQQQTPEGSGLKYIIRSSELSPFIKFLPRCQSTVADAALGPLIKDYFDRIEGSAGPEFNLTVMTSAGGLVPRQRCYAKDMLLSGPAGGVVGSAASAIRAGFRQSIAFDMGGTSTDVSRCEGALAYKPFHVVGDATLMTPALKIETVASGGGSICSTDGQVLKVGPESAGASPGPACYGAGGPLTLTDVNLLLGRVTDRRFGIPLYRQPAEDRLREIVTILAARDTGVSDESVLESFLRIANERMSEAIRKISVSEGYDPAAYALVAFGGAGGMHGCAISRILGISHIVFPAEAGLLSAEGLETACLQTFSERQCMQPLDACAETLVDMLREMREEALSSLTHDSDNGGGVAEVDSVTADLRLSGQESALTIDLAPEPMANNLKQIGHDFIKQYASVFGYEPAGKPLELVSLRLSAKIRGAPSAAENFDASGRAPVPDHHQRAYFKGNYKEVPVFFRENLQPGGRVDGPALVADAYSTLVIEPNWMAVVGSAGTLRLDWMGCAACGSSSIAEQEDASVAHSGVHEPAILPEAAQRELFINRFRGIVDEMGEQLRRTALSTNVKERLDYSCGLLDPDGYLIVNAPHIPVHLGAMGLCVRELIRRVGNFSPGDMFITNHPALGGSHLPDITVVSPVFASDPEFSGENAAIEENSAISESHSAVQASGMLIGFVANRAHHAEIGGTRPGSMPPDAKCLAEEGVVIRPMHLFRQGKPCFDTLRQTLTDALYPTRAIEDNIADIRAQAAANLRGTTQLISLARRYGADTIVDRLRDLRRYAADTFRQWLIDTPGPQPVGHGPHDSKDQELFPMGDVEQYLDDGTRICLRLQRRKQHICIDWTGTAPRHPLNFNATPAIVQSAILYCLRIIMGGDLPLNEGVLDHVEIILPECFLNPRFHDNLQKSPAVVAGNVETSQRLVDALLLAAGAAACSQGTMNNFLFGNENISYYETICGGAGATASRNGASAVHTHMTNTAITDPEILESRFPVRLLAFGMRKGSGGSGRNSGGDGAIRILEFLTPLSLSLLTQRRTQGPEGIHGGSAGMPGKQTLYRMTDIAAGQTQPSQPPDDNMHPVSTDVCKYASMLQDRLRSAQVEQLDGVCRVEARAGDILVVETPGGGAWGG